MEDSFKGILFAFIFMALFGVLIITVVNDAGTTYNKDLTGVTDGSLDLTKFNDSVSGIEQDAKDLKATFTEGSVWSAIAGVVVEGVFGIAKDMINLILSPFDIISDILINILGVPSIVSSVILGVLILAIIFGIWALIKVGN